jgi:hypothetical protein
MSRLAPEARHLLELDLRPVQEVGGDPWEAVGAALARLPADGVLTLATSDRPTPVLTRLEEQGYRVSAGRGAGDLWSVAVQPPGAPEIADLRDLPAPEPLEGVLAATARLAPGAAFLARVPRYPRMLLPRLSERGLEFEVREEQDGTALVHVRRPR